MTQGQDELRAFIDKLCMVPLEDVERVMLERTPPPVCCDYHADVCLRLGAVVMVHLIRAHVEKRGLLTAHLGAAPDDEVLTLFRTWLDDVAPADFLEGNDG